MFELLKVEKIIIFSKNMRVRIIRASELIEDIRYAAAVKVYLNDILHALTMHSAGAVRLRYSMSPQVAF